jgi:UDP:flavonoid glycosyltransferase YjiC (YdhE family)
MDILLTSLGSHGDIHPYIGIGKALAGRGHDVTLLLNPYFESLVTGAGLRFEPLGTAELFRTLADDKDLWNPRKGFKVVFGAVLSALEEHYERTCDYVRAHPGAVVGASSLCLGTRCAQDKLGFRCATIHLSPAVFRSYSAPPRLPGLYMPRWYPRWLKHWLWDGGDKYFIDPFIAPRLNEFRSRVGLSPVSHILRDWWNSPDMVIALFPDWYAPRQDDWPAQTRMSDFPLYDERDQHVTDPRLESFLSEGPPPIAFTPGSAMLFGGSFFRSAADACQILGMRGLLLTRHAEQIPSRLPPGVIHVPYAPFSTLLPRVAALVHHGGMGTTAQALRAGTPQLIMRMAHDQYDNALRVRRLGVGAEVKPSRFTARRVASALRRLLNTPGLSVSCQAVSARFKGVDGIEMACNHLESLAQPASTEPPLQRAMA